MPVRIFVTEGTWADCKEAVHLIEGFSARPVFVRRIGKTKPPVILGVSKKSFSNRITLLCYDKGGLATTNKNIGGFCNEYRHKKFITFEMEMQIPYCICAQISKTGNIWKAKSWYRKNTEDVMREKGDKYYSGGMLSGSYPYAGRNTTTYQCIWIYGILEKQKQFNDIWQACKFEI